jgi:hypothetical protein
MINNLHLENLTPVQILNHINVMATQLVNTNTITNRKIIFASAYMYKKYGSPDNVLLTIITGEADQYDRNYHCQYTPSSCHAKDHINNWCYHISYHLNEGRSNPIHMKSESCNGVTPRKLYFKSELKVSLNNKDTYELQRRQIEEEEEDIKVVTSSYLYEKIRSILSLYLRYEEFNIILDRFVSNINGSAWNNYYSRGTIRNTFSDTQNDYNKEHQRYHKSNCFKLTNDIIYPNKLKLLAIDDQGTESSSFIDDRDNKSSDSSVIYNNRDNYDNYIKFYDINKVKKRLRFDINKLINFLNSIDDDNTVELVGKSIRSVSSSRSVLFNYTSPVDDNDKKDIEDIYRNFGFINPRDYYVHNPKLRYFLKGYFNVDKTIDNPNTHEEHKEGEIQVHTKKRIQDEADYTLDRYYRLHRQFTQLQVENKITTYNLRNCDNTLRNCDYVLGKYMKSDEYKQYEDRINSEKDKDREKKRKNMGNKYLKYKQKYLELKKMLNSNFQQ